MESFAFPVLLCGFLVLALAHFFKVNNDVRHVEQRLMQVQSELSTRLEQLEKETSKQQENITSTLSDVKKEFEMNDFVSEVESRQFIGLMENVNKLAIRMREYQQDTLETSDKIKNLENDLRRVDKQMSTILLADIHDMLLMSDYVKNLEERLVQENITSTLSDVKKEFEMIDFVSEVESRQLIGLMENVNKLATRMSEYQQDTLETSDKIKNLENDLRRVDKQMSTILEEVQTAKGSRRGT